MAELTRSELSIEWHVVEIVRTFKVGDYFTSSMLADMMPQYMGNIDSGSTTAALNRLTLGGFIALDGKEGKRTRYKVLAIPPEAARRRRVRRQRRAAAISAPPDAVSAVPMASPSSDGPSLAAIATAMLPHVSDAALFDELERRFVKVRP